nr:uncharacterized protein LOC124810442 isoform X2 [Hydra vulgaris]XP_047131299.1 uncharacterized protein LOC124810442 isoform X2 [Hydra vulgaris]XP_047131301.1 uncharacterized protein LOC124810442 isoform X2 [Hydra vulgaris]XP_047131302.1 uncharacterized protein LOC124810442 isoform X2 [Hydra vulgaris]XP_047131303.1 uncharacterized protein LOC124810442 isoform X2 [Hydra vulgaris]XP_047131304.1 uncharacterized protein LOC124810442 isoform X2 [Hydra vulgaris]
MQNVILKELAEIKVLLKDVIEIKFQATGVKLLELVDEVVTLDNKLKDKTEYTNLLDSLKRIGGGKPREHVFLIMKRLFSNRLQSKLNRKGNGEKISLENLVNIWSVLRGIVLIVFTKLIFVLKRYSSTFLYHARIFVSIIQVPLVFS